MFNLNFLKIFPVLILFVFFFESCTNSPLRRNNSKYRNQSRKSYKAKNAFFNPIKKKVALLTLFNESPFGKEDLAIVATEELRREVAQTSDFVVDPDAAALFGGSSKEIYAGGGVKLAQLSRQAKLSGVNLVIFGRIVEARIRQQADEIGFVRKTRSYAQSEVEIRVFDVLANKEIFIQKMDGNINDATYKFFLDEKQSHLDYRRSLLRYSVKVAVRRFIPQLAKLGAKLDWTGRVAKIIGSQIYINAGRRSGLNVNDILKVMTEGQEVFDPESGALLGVSKGEVKGTLEVIDYFGPDGAVAVLHSGGSVTEGDFVQLY